MLATKRKIKKIFVELREAIGDFKCKSISHSYLEKNKSFLISASDEKYVLKIKNLSENPKKEILQEIKTRNSLRKIFNQAKITNYFITEVVEYNLEDYWILTKYVEFETLYSIFKKDKKRFKKIIIEFYRTIILPLDDKVDPKIPINVDFGLNDLGYQAGKFYFFDFEPQKKVSQIIVDTYARLIHIHLLRTNQNRPRLAAFVEQIIDEVKKLQEKHINKRIFNSYLKTRLKSPTLREQLKEKNFEKIYQKFKY